MKEFKILVIGPPGCGKSQFIRVLAGLPFNKNILPTKGLSITPVIMIGNQGVIKINFWEINVKNMEYFRNTDHVINMFDSLRRYFLIDLSTFKRGEINFRLRNILAKADNHFELTIKNGLADYHDFYDCGEYYQCCSAKNSERCHYLLENILSMKLKNIIKGKSIIRYFNLKYNNVLMLV
jgi:GTPase SAR1 family protein